MRRRPTAVYRVIDEEELLGGHATADSSIPMQAWRAPAGPPASHSRWRGLTGWGSTALAVGALAAVAAALLSLGEDVGASNSVAARRQAVARTPLQLETTVKGPSRCVRPSDRRRTPTRPRFAASTSSTARLGGAKAGRMRPRATARRRHPAELPAATVPLAEPSPAQAGPAQEFGFER
jgi:hypothetical protein